MARRGSDRGILPPSLVRKALPLMLCLLLCSSAWPKPRAAASQLRQVHTKIVVDPSYAASALWRVNVGKLMDAVNALFRSWCDVEFVIDTAFVLDVNADGGCRNLTESDCVQASVPKGSSDIVIRFSKESNPYEYQLAGLANVEQGYVMVWQMGWQQAREPFKFAFHALVHELGHVFGAMHIVNQRSDGPLYIMQTAQDWHTARRAGTGFQMPDPEFDAGNAMILQAMVGRPFSFEHADPKDWATVRRTYEQQVRDHNSWSLKKPGGMLGAPMNLFYVYEPYRFLAMWASLYGHDSLALRYVDSLDLVVKQLPPKGVPGAGYGSGYTEWGLKGLEVSALFSRALLHFKMGRDADAEEDVSALERLARDYGYQRVDRIVAGLRQRKNAYLRDKPRSESPNPAPDTAQTVDTFTAE